MFVPQSFLFRENTHSILSTFQETNVYFFREQQVMDIGKGEREDERRGMLSS